GLKWGTYLPGSATASPVFGLRPVRGGRKCSEKLPKPRISMRSPRASEAAIISSSDLTARSTSSAFRCAWRWVRISISSDLVIFDTPVEAGGGPPRGPPPGQGARPRGAGRRRPKPPSHLLGLVLQLLAQQRAQLGGAAGGFRRRLVVLGEGLGRLGLVLGADRQLQGAALAVLADVLGLDRVTDLQVLAGVVDADIGDVARGHVAFHAVAQVDDRTLGVDFLHRAAHLRAARMVGQELPVRILLELLDPQRDALALRVDRQHHRLEGLALLEVAGHVLAGGVPADVGQVDQAVDSTLQ